MTGAGNRSIRVLAIEESGADLSHLFDALRDDRCDVLVASSEREARDLLSAHRVDCVLLPAGAAGTLRERIAALHIPLFVTLASDDAAMASRALDDGADECAPVSESPDLLRARLRALLRRTRAHEAQMAAMTGALARKDAELVSLNYAISHDLRAPLRAIDGFGRILQDECAGTLDGKRLDYLRRVTGAARELGVLIDDLLQLSRVGRAELRQGRLDLGEIARRVAGDLQAASPRTVEVVIEDGLVAHADRTLMRLAVEHLIGNSWKFTAPAAAPRIEFRAEPVDGRPVFVVRDNGAGFDPSRAGKLFQPVQRLHTASEFEGAGIGLAVVHKIVDRHGGRVWADGRPGEGASVYFTLPPAPAGEAR